MESFITPIILNYVDKYVILRAQDAQLSIWEGDVAFQNLDLRLDVLQEELQLPFEFLSGHIHELIIHIPWTKITSEPISVTINTIEFVLKLRDLNIAASPKIEKSKAVPTVEESPKGYINTLVDKIVNNISITCNNIILKYVEDDIVVSMNVQLLSFCSADDQWNKAFIDLSPHKVVLRKLVQVSDLTICLDKRNSAGQIDVCQEPILYRCSLDIRILRQYNNATVQTKSTTNIAIFTKSLELNISSQQFPMAMRLIALIAALRSSELKSTLSSDMLSESFDNSEMLGTGSMLSWAWNKMPSLFSPEDSIDDLESNDGHLLSTGIYIGSFKVTLKSVEMFADSIVQNSRKIRYNPIMRLTFIGIYAETVIGGPKWFNTKAGISHATIEPLGSFVTNQLENAFLVTGGNYSDLYFSGSLFDPNFIGNNKSNKIIQDWESHFHEINEEYLLNRTPAIAFDMVHYIQFPDDKSLLSELGSDLEYSNISEKTIIRAFISSTTIKYSSAMLRIINTVNELISSYDYLPYLEERTEAGPSKLPPPSMDDYDALMNDIPRKTFQLTLINFNIEMHPLNEAVSAGSKPNLFIKSSNKKRLPFIILRIDHMKVDNISPIYQNRLVHTTCQLPVKPKELLDACYNTFEISVKNIVMLISDNLGELRMLSIPNICGSYGKILKENVWADNMQTLRGFINVDSVILTFTRPQEIIFLRIFNTLPSYNKKSMLEVMNSSARKDMYNKVLDSIELRFLQINVEYSKYRHAFVTVGNLASVKGIFLGASKQQTAEDNIVMDKGEQKFLLFDAPREKITGTKFIEWRVQIPNEYSNMAYPSVAMLTVKESVFVIDPALEKLLMYDDVVLGEYLEDEKTFAADVPSYQDVETKSSRISGISATHANKKVHPAESIHISSDKEEKIETRSTDSTSIVNKSTNSTYIMDILPFLNRLILSIELSPCEIIISMNSVEASYNFLEHVLLEDFTSIKLPNIKCKSLNSAGIENLFTDLPIILLDPAPNSEKGGFPWTFSISELSGLTSSKGEKKPFLLPNTTNITIAFDTKTATAGSHYALNLHLDTSPITFNLSEDQILFLKKALNLVILLPNLITYTGMKSKIIIKEEPTVMSTLDDDSNIKDFLAINTNSEMSIDAGLSLTDDPEESSFSIWLQWTLTKITINLLSLNSPVKAKLSIELEDFITSIDKQYVYFKLKSKIGVFNAQYFNLNEKHEWIANSALKLTVQEHSDEGKTSDTFLDITVTIAETGNVFKKWGEKKRVRNLNRSLTEIVANIQAIHLQLNVKLLEDMKPLVNALGAASVNSTTNMPVTRNTESKSLKNPSIISASDLPLLYFESKGITCYIGNDSEMLKHKHCDVVILKIGQIKISPNVENPLTRMPIRPDVYTKAAQMRILNIPGSKVEDRQYELLISDISTVTSNWNDMLLYMKENSENCHSTNPAFEWNNQSKKPAVKLHEIFKKFEFSITYAPCIVYKTALICGQSLELNCVADLIVNITTDQVLLLNNITAAVANSQCIPAASVSDPTMKNRNIIQVNRSRSNRSFKFQPSATKITKSNSNTVTALTKYTSLLRINKIRKIENRASNTSNKITSENILTDSGIASTDKALLIESRDTSAVQSNVSEIHQVPYESSFVAGVFSFKLYQSIDDESDLSDDFESRKVMPLLAISITQPSMLISQKLYERTVKYSLFNLMISFGATTIKDDICTHNFDDVIFETRKGTVNSAGISPPLISINYVNTFFNKTEIECSIGRPTKLLISHKTLEKFLNIRSLLNDAFIVKTECPEKEYYKPLVRGTTIQMIRNSFFNADRLCLSLEQIILECRQSKEYDAKLSISKIKTNLDISDRPERLNFQCDIESLILSTERRIMIHPVSINIDGCLLQESWNRFPIITCKVDMNVLHVDIGAYHLLNIMQIQKIMMESVNTFAKQCQNLDNRNSSRSAETVNLNNLESISLPEVTKTQHVKPRDEFYQDDLRAGAFQFIEANDDEFALPLPYQIKIATNAGILCWRYPQPRSLSKLQLYPIPLETSVPLNIKCSLEYYNEALTKFVSYYEFSLSETKTQFLELPINKIAANIWRVVILQKLIAVDGRHFEESASSEDDEELQNLGITKVKIEDVLGSSNTKKKTILHPKALVACIHIDSYFNPELIPKVQFVLNATLIQINFQNNFKIGEKGLPIPIQQYTIARDFLETQTFASLILSNMKFHGLLWDSNKYSASLELIMSCTILDYSYLNMLHLLEHTNAKVTIDVRNSIEVNTVIDTLRVNFGPAMMHTLLVSEQLWSQLLNNCSTYATIVTRFVICNCSNASFQFGQTDSSELLLLKPNQCSFYSFRSDHLKQKLTFVFDEKFMNGSCSADIEMQGVQYLKVGNSVIVLKIEKLSSTQLCVFVKGQVEFLSMSKEIFRIQHRFSVSKEHQIELPRYGQGSFIGECNNEMEHFIRLKFGDEKRKGWSGEIPLLNKNIPWLVKVPSSTSHQYITFWVRVVVENIKMLTTKDFKPKRILVIIWPMFVVRSLLTIDMEAIETKTDSIYNLMGRGATEELLVAGTNETEHELIFSKEFYSSEGEKRNKAMLSYKAVDWNKFFSMDDKFSNIEFCLKELMKPVTVNWPCSKNDELKLIRMSPPREETTPIYRCLPSREFSCSLMLEILPSCLFINSSGNSLRITNLTNDNNFIVDSNNIAMLFLVKDKFTIDIGCGTHWIQSRPIYVNESSFKKNAKKDDIMIVEDGHVAIQIFHTSVISKYLLTSTSENNIRLFTLTSMFAIINLTNHVLNVIPFAFGDNEKIHREQIDELARSFSFEVPNITSQLKMKGIPIDQFYDICGTNVKRNLNTPLKYYICITMNARSDVSLPLLISRTYNRTCFSIQNGAESIPLAACVIEKDGQFFLNIFNDTCPAVELTNNTDLTFFIAETKTIDNSKQVKITPELMDKGFVWYQIMRSKSKLYYTPPEMYTTFPDIENSQSNLSLALCLQSEGQRRTYTQNIRWSKPLYIGTSSEKLLNIPLHGNVKIIICDNHKTTKISIFYIKQHMEFSVKDLRTRLLDPNKIENSTDLLDQTAVETKRIQPQDNLNENKLLNMDYNICPDHIIQSGTLKINVFIMETSIVVFADSKKQNYLKSEIFSLSIDDLIFQFDGESRSVELVLSNLQLDNQLYSTGNYDFPVILCSQELFNHNSQTPSPVTLRKDIENYKTNAFAQLRLNYYKERFDIESVHCKIKPIRSYIEDTYLNHLFDHLVDCNPSNVVYIYKDAMARQSGENGFIIIPEDVIKQAMYLSEPLKLKSIKIEPVSVMLSVHTCVRLYIALDHSPLDFSTYERRNILTLPLRFGHTLGMHYLSGALFGAGWVVGSLEILGSPSGLARSLSTGLRDFVSMPAQGLFRGPWGFLTGITQGSASLLRNITAGTVNSVSKLAASVARNLDRLTLDEEHFQRTEALRRSRPQGFTEGFSQGITGLGISLLGAVGGLARHPLEATSSVGVVTGVAKGIFGALAKPLSGAAELVALTGQGMLHTVGFNTMPRQRSPTIIKNTAAYPADCKLSWKFLPNMLSTDQILFYHDAAMITDEHLKRVIICLTPSALAVLENARDMVLEIIPIERIEISINAKDPTLIDIKVLHCNEYNEEADTYFINTRILSFLRDSSDHLASTSTQPFEELLAERTNNIERKYKFQWSFYVSEHLALHLLKYITLVKCSSEYINQSVD